MATVFANTGKTITANRIKGTGTEPLFGAWGTSGSAAAVTDVALGTESPDEARVSGTSSIVTTTLTNDTYQVVALHTCATNPKTITEMALFDAISGGVLFMKSSFTGVPLILGEKIEATWGLKIA